MILYNQVSVSKGNVFCKHSTEFFVFFFRLNLVLQFVHPIKLLFSKKKEMFTTHQQHSNVEILK